MTPPRDQCLCDVLGWITNNPCFIGKIADDDRSGCNRAVFADCNSRQYDRPRSDQRTFANASVEIKTASHIMRQDHNLFIDDAIGRDMNAARPSPVDQRALCDPGAGVDIHLPQPFAQKSLPQLAERALSSGAVLILCHFRRLWDSDWFFKATRRLQDART